MPRAAVGIAVALCACGGGGTADPRAGIEVRVRSRDDHGKVEWYLEARYRYAPPAKGDEVHLQVRAACQVGALRLVDDAPEYPRFRPQLRGERPGWYVSTPFVLSELPAKPSLCDLQITEHLGYRGAPRPLYEVCARLGQPPTPGRCPPNLVDGDGTGGGWSVPALEIEHVEPDPDGVYLSGEQLVLRYTVQAHRDQPADTWMHVTIACANGAADEVSHQAAGGLRAGEAFHAAQIKLHQRVPPSTTPCAVTFGARAGVDGTATAVAQFCYRDRRTVPGPCS
ncbi:MAG: hypothetical protein IPL61_23625 [Myxococcales bacterium]|nr:hypothetical protein [Myxococcales bacterium]